MYVLKPVLLDNTSKEQYVTGERGVRWTDVHMKLLHFADCVSGSKPARRVCAIHAAAAISHAEDEGWIKVGQIRVPDEAWECQGYDTELLQSYLQGLPIASISLAKETPFSTSKGRTQ